MRMQLLGERQTKDRKAINAALAKRVRYAGAIADQAAGHGKFATYRELGHRPPV